MLTLFLVSSIMSSLTVAGIWLIKKLFRKQLSVKTQYHLWFLLFLALALPFLPTDLIVAPGFFVLDRTVIHEIEATPARTNHPVQESADWLQDFTISIQDSTPAYLDTVVAGVWIAGMCLFSLLMVRAWLQLVSMKKTITPLHNKEILALFEQCKQELRISKALILGQSPLVRSPMMFGMGKTYVVLPAHVDEWLSMEEIRHIFLHELVHYKHKDLVTNYGIALFQIVYWFNPLVWLAFREMRVDREIACDHAVLERLGQGSYAEYGNTILHFVDRGVQARSLVFSSQLNGPKVHIKKRIEKIAAFTTESKLLKLKSVAIFALAGAMVASQIPLVSVMAEENHRYAFRHERVVYEDLASYFAGFEGSFVLYDSRADSYRIFNEPKSVTRVSPDSTYKIFLALFGLESDSITSEQSLITWNGVQYPYEAWNQDQTVYTALENSTNWYFDEVDRRIGLDRVRDYVKRTGYGNGKVSGGTSPYYLESSLTISPVEQVQLLHAFYTNQWGFAEQNVQTVKEAIRLEEKDGKVLSGKTGTGTVNNKNQNGWFVGYVETEGNTYFFATNIQREDGSDGRKAAEITLSILQKKGIY
ncbi:BlaR1 family beta-lactam sensor/signal transducer [Brevibacillus sp. TJ4]|uniref:BlaR1 family beta-lactam sensor/signal transducer n=1 Tax=Brevibacillus sp. TJ4 TaxID=3234853 RepID=UPI0037D019DC